MFRISIARETFYTNVNYLYNEYAWNRMCKIDPVNLFPAINAIRNIV